MVLKTTDQLFWRLSPVCPGIFSLNSRYIFGLEFHGSNIMSFSHALYPETHIICLFHCRWHSACKHSVLKLFLSSWHVPDFCLWNFPLGTGPTGGVLFSFPFQSSSVLGAKWHPSFFLFAEPLPETQLPVRIRCSSFLTGHICWPEALNQWLVFLYSCNGFDVSLVLSKVGFGKVWPQRNGLRVEQGEELLRSGRVGSGSCSFDLKSIF